MGSKKNSVVISASLKTGCYRHLQICMDETLEEFAETIIDSFGFINDHGHAFFMDNRIYSEKDCYYVDFMADDEFTGETYKSTSDYTVRSLKLKEGKKFKFVYDFGEDWTFSCKVLRFSEDNIPDDLILKCIGGIPQPDYFDYDEDYDEDYEYDELLEEDE